MFRKLWSHIYPAQIPVQGKMILCLLLTVILPLSVFIPLLHVYQNSITEEEIRAINMDRANQTSEQLEMIYEQINSVSNLYFLDGEIERILREGRIYDYQQLERDNAAIVDLQRRYNATLSKVDLHVTIISDDNRIYGDGSYNVKSVPLSQKEDLWWYKQLKDSSWQTLWVKDSYLDELHGTSNLSYVYSVRLLKRFDNWENHGILIVSFLESDLVKLYANTVPKSGGIFIINRDGSLVSMVDNAGIYSSGFINQLPESYSASTLIEIHDMDYQVVTNTVRSPLWQVVIATPDQQLRAQYQGVSLIPVLTVLFLIVLITFSVIVSFYIVKPIRLLTENIQQIGKDGVLSQRIEVRTTDEIGILSAEFNHMLERVDELMAAMVNEQTAKRNAELQALYAQINPHFIYNTLTSIRFLIISGDATYADQALRNFITLLRSSISNKEELWTFQQEIDLLQKYIDIQQLFFDEPFTVVWDIAPEIRLCKTIRLSLQPIVENAILHGLKSKQGYKELSIKIVSEGENIRGSIRDNGIGTSKTFCFDKMSKEFDRNIGLKNVHSRFALHFGEGYGLQFFSIPGQGTQVQFLVPKIEEKKEIM